ncbi:NACHT, LRR and PYD domains-containing protein 12-like [Rhinoderma darwinii]|uniref:NACHT, LRR and PYD domains-containing protein 12-like n=1 Tax=Rhinoderma darwinii TaxID=43563 RepID=UPI003F661330
MCSRMSIISPSDDDGTRQFYQQLCQYEDHALRMIREYFQDDLLHIVENMNTNSLLDQLNSRNIPDIEKYRCLENDKKSLARTLLQDILHSRREAVIGLWVSLHVLQGRHDSLVLHAVLEELRHTGNKLVEQILLDEHGHRLPPELKDVQNCHKKHLYEKTENLLENKPPGSNLGEERFPFCTRYVNLIIVSTDHFRERSENELIRTGVKHEEYLMKKQNELQRIYPNKMFRWCHRSGLVPQMVMVSGVPGVGKTTLMQKFVCDWVKGVLYQRFSFVFFFKFRELNRLDKVSLETMILHQYPYLRAQLRNILQDPGKLLFIFDGLDETVHKVDFTSRHLCSNPKQPEHCGQIVVSLVRKSLLNGCSVLMTSRPTKLASINCEVFQQIVEITGFFPEERRMYFENFFPNQEVSERAFNYVKRHDTLYTFCYLPSYCWIICTVLSKSFQLTSSDQVSLLPKTVTQLFAIFVANILSNHSLHKSDAQKILQSIGWLAEHGVMNHMIIFDERDLDSFDVDNKSKLLSSFLMESEEPVTYSFLHLTVQEFFSALVHYTDYSPEKLQKSLKEAKSYSDGRGEIFLRFLCGLSDGSTRSILAGYLEKQAAQASRDVITWLKNFILEEQSLVESEDKKRRLLRTFFYLYETRNKALVQESLKSHTRLDLSNVYMSALDCAVLAFILGTCTNIEELNLRGCSLQTEGLERLAPVLHNLQNLSLGGNDLLDTSCIQLASGIRNNRSLKILDLSDNRLSGPHLSDLMEALSSPDCGIEELRLDSNVLPDTSCIQLASGIRNNRSLKKLDLYSNRLSGPHLSDLMEALSSPDCGIEELYLGNNDLPDTSCIQLAYGIRNNRSLKILVLCANRLSGPHLSDLMEALSSPDCGIEVLNLDNNDLPGTSCIQLASGIRNNRSLKKLHLSNNRLSGPHLSDLMEALSSPDCGTEELHLGDNHLPGTSCIQLASGIRNNRSLKKLHLSNNRLSGPHLSDLMEALSSPDCGIEELHLGGNGLPGTSCIQLASGIRNNWSLKKLDLSSNRLSGPHLSNLMEALSSPDCGIEELHLGDNRLPDTSCIQLASGIRNNRSLKRLLLSINRLSGPHLSDLMEALSSPDCGIEELHLGDNRLPDTSCIQLASVIRNNRSLKKLDLSSNRLSGPHLSDLMEALSSPDCGIEELHLGGNDLPDTSCIQLASGIRNNRSLKKLDLFDNRLSGPHLGDLMEALSSPDCGIEELHLDGNYLPDIPDANWMQEVRIDRFLKILDLSGNLLSGPHLRDLMEALSSPDCGIEELHLGNNYLPDTFCIQLASAIRNNRSLKRLFLYNNRLSGPHLSDLMEALSSPDCGIEELHLGNNHLPDTSCIQLASGIRNNRSLKILDLYNNSLSGPHLSDLMEALSSPDCGIEELRLGGNDLPDTSCIQLASGIRNNRSLKILDLYNNSLSGPHLRDLMEALSSPDCGIEELRLGDNDLPDTSCIQLASAIRNNRSLKKLDLSDNRLSGPHLSDLMEALSSPDCGIEEL